MATAQLHATATAVRNILIATDLSRHLRKSCTQEWTCVMPTERTRPFYMCCRETSMCWQDSRPLPLARDVARRDLAELEQKLPTNIRTTR